jgi:hypothetical protein
MMILMLLFFGVAAQLVSPAGPRGASLWSLRSETPTLAPSHTPTATVVAARPAQAWAPTAAAIPEAAAPPAAAETKLAVTPIPFAPSP